MCTIFSLTNLQNLGECMVDMMNTCIVDMAKI